MSERSTQSTQPPDWRELRREERREMRGSWHGGPWIGGVVLIALGVIFLLQNFGYPIPENWWALFLLVPAVGAFMSAWSSYQKSGGQITGAVRGGVIGGVLLTLLAGLLYFNIDFGKFWPVVLIVIGASLLFGNPWRRS